MRKKMTVAARPLIYLMQTLSRKNSSNLYSVLIIGKENASHYSILYQTMPSLKSGSQKVVANVSYEWFDTIWK